MLTHKCCRSIRNNYRVSFGQTDQQLPRFSTALGSCVKAKALALTPCA